MRKNFGDRVVNSLERELNGEHFVNSRHSNRNGETYQVVRTVNGLYDLAFEIKYSDGVTDYLGFSELREDQYVSTIKPSDSISLLPPGVEFEKQSKYERRIANPNTNYEEWLQIAAELTDPFPKYERSQSQPKLTKTPLKFIPLDEPTKKMVDEAKNRRESFYSH